jgi:hypothetical protein
MEILPSMVTTQPKVYISNPDKAELSPVQFSPSPPASAGTGFPRLFSKTTSMTSEQSFRQFAPANSAIAQFWPKQKEPPPADKVSLFMCRPLAESTSSVFEDEKGVQMDQVQQIMSYLHLDETDAS